MKELILFIATVTAIWIAIRFFFAKKLQGKSIEIRPFRSDGKLRTIGSFTVNIEKVIRIKDDIWFTAPLIESIELENEVYDYIQFKPKSVDDKFSRKKDVITTVMCGNSRSTAPPVFLDWGLVKVL